MRTCLVTVHGWLYTLETGILTDLTGPFGRVLEDKEG